MDNSHIDIILQQQVKIYGDYHIESDGTVNVDGDVEYSVSINQLKVQFSTITGNFSRSNSSSKTPRLNSLQGFPRKVMGQMSVARSRVTNLHHAPNQVNGSFYAYHCENLHSLQGAPRWVGGEFIAYNCALTHLQGAPLIVKGMFDVSGNPLANYDHVPEECTAVILPYNRQAPILKLLVYPRVEFRWDGITHGNHTVVNTIMRKYAGQGKAGAIKCAAELIKAGYKENARW